MDQRQKRYLDKLDQITIRPHKLQGTAIRQAAAAKGQSVQAYILAACKAQQDRDGSNRLYVGIPIDQAKKASHGQDPRIWLTSAMAHLMEGGGKDGA